MKRPVGIAVRPNDLADLLVIASCAASVAGSKGAGIPLAMKVLRREVRRRHKRAINGILDIKANT